MNASEIAREIEDIADRVARLTVWRNDPHRFFEDKSELRRDLRDLASAVRTGRKPAPAA